MCSIPQIKEIQVKTAMKCHWNETKWRYSMQFSIAVATYDYKFSGLIQPKCILLLFCSQKSHAGLRSSCWQHSSGGSRGESASLPFPASKDCGIFGLWLLLSSKPTMAGWVLSCMALTMLLRLHLLLFPICFHFPTLWTLGNTLGPPG